MLPDKTKEDYLKKPLEALVPEDIEREILTEKIIAFIKGYFQFHGFKKAVVGLSGGLDSSLVAHLCVKALGEGRVYGVLLPSKFTSAEHIEQALGICKKLKIEYNDFDIVHEYFNDALEMMENMGERASDEKLQRVKSGNIQARLRMIILRDIAKRYDGLVIGTTNLTELKLGYATMAGDGLGGIDIEPIAGIYKTTERFLASFVGVSQDIIDQTPTAELWDGQTDEAELDLSYKLIDQILLGFEYDCTDKEIVQAISNEAVTTEKINDIRKLINKNGFKNMLPPSPRLT